METPNNHHGMFLPERKNSFDDEPAFLETLRPIARKTTKNRRIMIQSSEEMFILNEKLN